MGALYFETLIKFHPPFYPFDDLKRKVIGMSSSYVSAIHEFDHHKGFLPLLEFLNWISVSKVVQDEHVQRLIMFDVLSFTLMYREVSNYLN